MSKFLVFAAGVAGVIVGFSIWLLLGCLAWLALGSLSIIWMIAYRPKVKDSADIAIVLAGKAVFCSGVIALSLKYGWLGPLLSAIVRAIKQL